MSERPLKIHGTLQDVLRVSVTKGVKPSKPKRKAPKKRPKRKGAL